MWCQIGVKPIPQRSKATVYLDFLVQRLHRMQTAYSPPSIFQNGADGLHKWISVLYRAGHSSFQSIRFYQHKFPNSDFFWIQCCSDLNISHTLASLLWAVISIQIIPELRITFNQSRSFLTIIAFHTVMESIRSLYRMVQYFLPKRFLYNSTSIGEQRISL